MQRRMVVLLMLLAALGVGSSVSLAGGGNSANAKLCQKNNWVEFQTASGGSFASEEACVSYGAQGGTLFAPAVSYTHNGCITEATGDRVDQWLFDLTGFTPNSSLFVSLNGSSLEKAGSFDGSGSITYHFNLLGGSPPAIFTITFSDGNGVQAPSVTFGPTINCA